MPDFLLHQNDPFNLILAADYRLGTQDLEKETVWEIQLDGGESGGISLYSTLALSASSLRIFPLFSNQSETNIKLSQFVSPLVIREISPSYARFQLEPFQGIIVRLEYWVKESSLILGRICVSNSSTTYFNGSNSWAVKLVPLEGGSNMKIVNTSTHPYLLGKTTHENLVFLSNGAPSAGKFGLNSLENELSLQPGAQQVFQWAFAREMSKSAAIISANSNLNLNWDAETARIEVLSQKDLFVFQTGNRDWDIALDAGQKLAHQLILQPAQAPKNLVFLKNRTPEQNFPIKSSNLRGINFSLSNVRDLWYALQVNPAISHLVKEKISEILQDFQSLEVARKKFDFSNFLLPKLPFPLLVTIVSEVFQMENDQEWLRENFASLCNYLKLWLSLQENEGNDFIPTWSNALQSLYEDLPIHNRWNRDGEGIETPYILSPMLLSLLFQEIQQAINLGKILQDYQNCDWLEQKQVFLQQQINLLWDGRKHRYRYADIFTHKALHSKQLFSIQGSGKFTVSKKLGNKYRLSLRVLSQQEHTRNVTLIISGENDGNRIVEDIKARNIHWSGQHGFYTTRNIFDKVFGIEVYQLPNSDSVSIHTSNFSVCDISLGLPLWAGACDVKRAHVLIEKWLLPEFLQASGLPLVPMKDQPDKNDKFNNVDLPINCMLLQGLLQYGYENAARQIVSNNLHAISKNLKLFHKMMQQYDASDGYGTGEYNIIIGAPPTSVFLKLAGINKWSRSEVIIDKISCFEKPITILYRGNTIYTTPTGHRFCSPGGMIIETTGKGPHHIRIPE